MDKRKLKKLILLGISSGLTAFSASGYSDGPSIDANSQCLLAKPACKGSNGCGGLTASRNLANTMDDEEDLNDEDMEETADDENKVKTDDVIRKMKVKSKKATTIRKGCIPRPFLLCLPIQTATEIALLQ